MIGWMLVAIVALLVASVMVVVSVATTLLYLTVLISFATAQVLVALVWGALALAE